MTMLDSLDTLWIMGMDKDVEEAAEWLKSHIDFGRITNNVSFMETTIRALGGLLAAFQFSKNAVFLDKARDLGDR